MNFDYFFRFVSVLTTATLVATLAIAGQPTPNSVSPRPLPNPEKVLTAAFFNRYEIDLTSIIELRVGNRSGQERRRTIEAITKVIDDRVHSIGRLVSPEHLRGMTVLMVEAQDRSHDAFLFLPSLDKVKRISTAQRGDAFFGTDVTYEDIEHQSADEFKLTDITAEEFDGEEVYVIRGEPLRRYNYHEVVFTIAQSDSAMLHTAYYKRNADKPYRTIRAPRETMVELGGHVLPTHMRVDNLMRGTYTLVQLTNMNVDTEIDDRIFSVRTLQSKTNLLRPKRN